MHMRKRLMLSFCAFLLLLTQSWAQSITVTGKVTDEKGQPIQGASILIRNTSSGTVTNSDGSFRLQARSGAHLTVSSVGYDNAEVMAAPELSIRLSSSCSTMTDVVVTGVGVATSKKRVPIDVASVSSKDFAKSATTSIEQGLQGQIAGALITQTSGQPGSGFNIVLR